MTYDSIFLDVLSCSDGVSYILYPSYRVRLLVKPYVINRNRFLPLPMPQYINIAMSYPLTQAIAFLPLRIFVWSITYQPASFQSNLQ